MCHRDHFQKSHIEIIFCFDEHENALNFVKLLSTVTSKNGKDSMPHAVNIIFNDIRPHIIPAVECFAGEQFYWFHPKCILWI